MAFLVLFFKKRLTTINPMFTLPYIAICIIWKSCNHLPMHFDFHNYTSGTILPVYKSEGILKNHPREFGLFVGEVTINYLHSLLIKAFLELLSYVICESSFGLENYGTSSLWVNFHCIKSLLPDKGPIKMPSSIDHY